MKRGKLVSIPYRYYKNTKTKKQREKRAEVSIPYRYYKNGLKKKKK